MTEKKKRGRENKEASASMAPKRKLWGRVALACLAIWLGWLLFVCWHWSREPARFDPLVLAGAQFGDELPPGAATVATSIRLAETILEKPGGYLSNDQVSPARLIDNIRNWEYGAVQQIRDTVQMLRQYFSRARAQSPEVTALVEAEARFSVSHLAWVMPSTEESYRQGIALLHEYLTSLSSESSERGVFVQRQDVLDNWLHYQQLRLGSLATRLRANAGSYQYDPEALTSEFEQVRESIPTGPNPWRERDDVFYEARGSVFVMYHMMKAIRHDFADVLDSSFALGSYNRALSELHAAGAEMRSPILLNGEEFGMLPNHSLTLAGHLAKAHLAISDLRQLLRGGN